MKIAILVLLVAFVAAQAPVKPAPVAKKWMCCMESDMYVPRWDSKCPTTATRRMQGMVEPYCTKKLAAASSRILQAIVHPVAPACSTFNARRRLQAVVPKKTYKCPVNIEGYQCFKNNTNKKCVA